MEYLSLILTAIGTIATIISTIKAIRAKNEANRILENIKVVVNQSSNLIDITNSGNNSGLISGTNAGEINYGSK